MSFTATVMWSAMATTSPTCRAPRSRRGARTLASRPAVPRVIIPNNASPRRGLRTVAMSSKEGGGGGWGKFLGGVLVGGVVFGAAGVLFAPQLSKTFLKGKDAAGKFLYEDWTEDEDEDSLERTRQDLNEKIAQLNSAIDTFSVEADRGLSEKITKLNRDVEDMEAAAASADPGERDGESGGGADAAPANA